jgi:uncharacterized protein
MALTSLITGGSSGIGLAFARELAVDGHHLVLVARDQERLTLVRDELQREHNVNVETLQADLATDTGIAAVEARLADASQPIDLFVNNAGITYKGSFLELTGEQHETLIHVNCIAVTRLAHAALEAMSTRQQGGVINVSSVSGFTPAARASATYSATKAFVTALTQGLATAFAATPITVSAVCPGFVRSEHHKRAGIDMSKLPGFLWSDAGDVARAALRAHRARKIICIPGWQYRTIVAIARVVPQSFVHQVARRLGLKKQHS